jgi:hypothetical protein
LFRPHGDRHAEIAPLSDKESARDFKIFVIPELHRAAFRVGS